MQRDSASVDRALKRIADYPGYEDQPLGFQAGMAAFSGKFSSARDFERRAVESATRTDVKDRAGWTQTLGAMREQFIGNPGPAVRKAHAALALSKISAVVGMNAVVLALAGETAEATRLRDDLSKRYPEDTLVQSQLIPLIQASLLMRQNKAAQAVDALIPAARSEFGGVQPGFRLFPPFLRGLALLQNKQADAGVEFQKIISHPGAVVVLFIGPLSRLGLARSYVLAGDTAKARTAYQDFFALWKDGDSDIPILLQAKSEYAKLQ